MLSSFQRIVIRDMSLEVLYAYGNIFSFTANDHPKRKIIKRKMAKGVDRDCHQPCAPVPNSVFFLLKRKREEEKVKYIHASLGKKMNSSNLSCILLLVLSKDKSSMLLSTF